MFGLNSKRAGYSVEQMEPLNGQDQTPLPKYLAPPKRSRTSFLITASVIVSLFISLAALLRGEPTVREYITNVVPDSVQNWSGSKSANSYEWDFARDEQKHGLTDEQCDIAFPGLFAEIERARESRRNASHLISSSDLDDMMDMYGMTRALIYEGKLYIVDSMDREGPIYHERTTAVLHQVNRAINGAPNPKEIPNIEFVMGMEDTTHIETGRMSQDRPIWAFTRRLNDTALWLMPEWGKWTELGSPEELRWRMMLVEEEIDATAMRQDLDPFELKYPKVLWRGSTWLNPEIRETLIETTKDKPWADVVGVVPGLGSEDQLEVEDQCRWQYLVYTEGVSYSGRMKYFHNCRSVIISHELEYMTPWLTLLERDGPDQNVVMVKRDWSDLEENMYALFEEPERARLIADNNVKKFRERYLTAAAESCYWRRLFSAWSEVSFKPHLYESDSMTGKRKLRATPFETFTMPGRFLYNSNISDESAAEYSRMMAKRDITLVD